MSTHNFGQGNKSWKEMTKAEKLQRSTIFRKDDVDKNFDWSVCGDDLDEFQADITGYVAEKKIGEEDIIKLIDEFTKSNLEIDVKIGSEIESLYDSENIP